MENKAFRKAVRFDRRHAQALEERETELNCLYRFLRLAEQHEDDKAILLQGIVDLLPSAFQNPKSYGARLTLLDEVFQTDRFEESPWSMSAPLVVRKESVGGLDVFCTRKPGKSKGNPFPEEKQHLLRALAGRVGSMIDHLWTREQLQEDRVARQEANTVLRAVLGQIEEHKNSVQDCLQENVQRTLIPVLDSLEKEIPVPQRRYIAHLRKHLEEITSPFTHVLINTPGTLTPAEIQVCELIRTAYSSKEIAQLRGVSPATVNKQRERIRRKLAIQGTRKNLGTHLLAISPPRA